MAYYDPAPQYASDGGFAPSGGPGPGLQPLQSGPPAGDRPSRPSEGRKLFLGGLEFSTTKETLLEYCQQWWVAKGFVKPQFCFDSILSCVVVASLLSLSAYINSGEFYIGVK
jgi:hypothetical protein